MKTADSRLTRSYQRTPSGPREMQGLKAVSGGESSWTLG
jgi:hypothetical protein